MAAGKIIGIIGAPGSGKTTLGKALSLKLGCHFIEEDWKSNPFVFGPKSEGAHGLEISLGFLVIRARQNAEARRLLNQGATVIMDTIFEMTDLYSKAFLDAQDYATFTEVYQRFAQDVTACDLVIHLYGPADLLAQRVRDRNLGVRLEHEQASEQAIPVASEIISSFVKRLDSSKVIEIDSSIVDLREDQHLQNLIRTIQEMSTF